MYEWGTDVLLNVSFSTIMRGYPKSTMPKLSRRAKRLVRKNTLNDSFMKKYLEYKNEFSKWICKEEITVPSALGLTQSLFDEYIT